MAKYGSDDLRIEFDNSAGTLQDMTQYITEINGVDVQAVLEETDTFGDSWAESLFTGLRRLDDIELTGFYDDTANTGPDAIFNDVGCVNTAGGTRTLKITWGGTKTTTIETIILSYRRDPRRREITRFRVGLRPTGAATEA